MPVAPVSCFLSSHPITTLTTQFPLSAQVLKALTALDAPSITHQHLNTFLGPFINTKTIRRACRCVYPALLSVYFPLSTSPLLHRRQRLFQRLQLVRRLKPPFPRLLRHVNFRQPFTRCWWITAVH